MLKKLNRANATSNVHRPVRVLQFGDGNFLRGFADWTIDILNEKAGFNGDVQIVRPLRKGTSKKNDEQDGLYHVALMGLQNAKVLSETRLITCISGFVDPYERPDLLLKAADNPHLKFIVSNTTESGIAFNPNDNDPSSMPDSFPGKVTLMLFHRFKTFRGDRTRGLIFLPCELIEKNGDTLKAVVLQYASLWRLPPEFGAWIRESNTFCNTLVDRIVPGFPKDNIAEIQSGTGYEDNQVVAAEPFHLWVVEAPKEVQELFPAHKVGLSLKYVDDLAPYRTRKVRILNGAHTALTPLAYLRGLRTVRESVEDNYCGEFLRTAIFEEIIPTLHSSKDELNQFANDVLERFKNPFIKHELKSIALNSISKFKVRVLPSIVEYNKIRGRLPQNLIRAFAALIRFYKGDWKGEALPVNDSADVISFFADTWKSDSIDQVVNSILANSTLWGEDLTKIDGLGTSIKRALDEVNAM